MVSTSLVWPMVTCPKSKLFVERVSCAMPVPVTAKTCGLPGALSEMLMLPSIAPVTLAANLTLMAQLSPAARLEQVFVRVKSPLVTMLVIARAFYSSVFVRVIT